MANSNNKWQNVTIHSNQIQYDTGRALLVKCPNNSGYAGYCFWHPAKLIRQSYRNRSEYSLSFTGDFEFHLQKKGQGKYNLKDVIAEAALSANEFKDLYAN